jgi:hypothetical protein
MSSELVEENMISNLDLLLDEWISSNTDDDTFSRTRLVLIQDDDVNLCGLRPGGDVVDGFYIYYQEPSTNNFPYP